MDPESRHFESTHRILHMDKTYIWFRARGAAIREEGRAVRMAGSLTDATERKQFEARLRYDALHDELTGLPNRVLFVNRVRHSIQRSKRRFARPFAVLFLDLDGFKVVNDSLGHDVGDQLLIEVADRLRECVRPGDTVARLGGDEFTILLEDTDHANKAEQVAERIQRELSRPWMLDGNDIIISTSIGIAHGSGGSHTPGELIRDADTAMYRAKVEGKAQHRVFDRAMHDTAVARLQLEAELRRAMAGDRLENEFHLVYQPLIRLRDGRLSGFEALLRWNNPERGVIGPDTFIRMAEETGLIAKIGWWALETAARQAVAWHKIASENPGLGPITVSVNLSSRQMHDVELVGRLEKLLLDLQLPENVLVVELTESLVMSHGDRVAKLRELGLRLSIDDFGTGYSSLRYLQEFDLDELKIDKSFVAKLSPDGGGDAIVRAIIALGHGLGLTVTAEGVETWLQFSTLRTLGCDRAQGFYFQKPMPRIEAERLLLSRPTW
jgi:diguanylate cyclase (GGDEF)-like protein